MERRPCRRSSPRPGCEETAVDLGVPVGVRRREVRRVKADDLPVGGQPRLVGSASCCDFGAILAVRVGRAPAAPGARLEHVGRSGWPSAEGGIRPPTPDLESARRSGPGACPTSLSTRARRELLRSAEGIADSADLRSRGRAAMRRSSGASCLPVAPDLEQCDPVLGHPGVLSSSVLTSNDARMTTVAASRQGLAIAPALDEPPSVAPPWSAPSSTLQCSPHARCSPPGVGGCG